MMSQDFKLSESETAQKSCPKGAPSRAAAACIALMLWAGMRVINWRCPRCGEPYLRGSFYHNAFARACLHCDLPKWADADPPAVAPESK